MEAILVLLAVILLTVGFVLLAIAIVLLLAPQQPYPFSFLVVSGVIFLTGLLLSARNSSAHHHGQILPLLIGIFFLTVGAVFSCNRTWEYKIPGYFLFGIGIVSVFSV